MNQLLRRNITILSLRSDGVISKAFPTERTPDVIHTQEFHRTLKVSHQCGPLSPHQHVTHTLSTPLYRGRGHISHPVLGQWPLPGRSLNVLKPPFSQAALDTMLMDITWQQAQPRASSGVAVSCDRTQASPAVTQQRSF